MAHSSYNLGIYNNHHHRLFNLFCSICICVIAECVLQIISSVCQQSIEQTCWMDIRSEWKEEKPSPPPSFFSASDHPLYSGNLVLSPSFSAKHFAKDHVRTRTLSRKTLLCLAKGSVPWKQEKFWLCLL